MDSENIVAVLDWFSFASGEVPRLTKQFIGQEQETLTPQRRNEHSRAAARRELTKWRLPRRRMFNNPMPMRCFGQ
jgi:hypothetical protein